MSKDTYTLRVRTKFSAAHQLHGYPGKCARLHGHNYSVEIEVQAHQLDEIGLAVDNAVIKEAAKKVIAPIEHQFLNEIPPFDKINPSAENIAKWLYEELSPIINREGVTICAVAVWETDNFYVRYEKQ